METAFLVIQCKAVTGQTGTFLANGKTAEGFVPVSPVFSDGCVPCFAWCRKNDWRSIGATPEHPCGLYQKES